MKIFRIEKSRISRYKDNGNTIHVFIAKSKNGCGEGEGEAKPSNMKPAIVSTLEVSFLRMVPTRFNSRFTVGAGNRTGGRNWPTTSSTPAVSLYIEVLHPPKRALLTWRWSNVTRRADTIPYRTSSYPGGKRRATHTGGHADTPRFSRACCYLAALSSDLLAGAPRGEVMLAGLVADKRVAAHTLKGRKETEREDACGCVCGWGCVYLFRLVVIHGSKGATRGWPRVDHPWPY